MSSVQAVSAGAPATAPPAAAAAAVSAATSTQSKTGIVVVKELKKITALIPGYYWVGAPSIFAGIKRNPPSTAVSNKPYGYYDDLALYYPPNILYLNHPPHRAVYELACAAYYSSKGKKS